MPVIHAADVQSHEMHGSRFTPLVRPATGSSELCVWRLEIAPGPRASRTGSTARRRSSSSRAVSP